MIRIKTIFVFMLFVMAFSPIFSLEMVIGEEKIKPGIVIITEAAVKDTVFPMTRNLNESKTFIHIEARVNWDENENVIPEGTPPGGFVPYLNISVEMYNRRTKVTQFFDLKPMINLIDNFHYAKNIGYFGKDTDEYDVTFYINPPSEYDISYHKDFVSNYGNSVIKPHKLVYRKLKFTKIAQATR